METRKEGQKGLGVHGRGVRGRRRQTKVGDERGGGEKERGGEGRAKRSSPERLSKRQCQREQEGSNTGREVWKDMRSVGGKSLREKGGWGEQGRLRDV